MEKTTIKKIAAGLEIYIYILVAFYLIQKYITKYYIEDIKDNFNSNRQNPLAIFLSGFFGKDSKDTFGGIISQKVKELFSNFLEFLTPIFRGFSSIFSIFQDQINGIRNILKPTRDFFKQATNIFYDKIQGFTIGIMYSLHKIRNTMRRSLSGFNLIFHTLEHNKNTIESLIESPPIHLAEKLLPPLDWVYSKGSRLARSKVCFDGETIINLKSKHLIPISMISVGDVLNDGSKVIAIHKFLNNNYLYRYNNVLVSGSHLVYNDLDRLVRVDSLKDAILTDIKPRFVYSLSTNTKRIYIRDTKFADYSESSDRLKNYEVNSLILSYLNNRPDVEAFPTQHLEHGLANDTPICMQNGTTKLLEAISIGDILMGPNGNPTKNIVIGKIEILPDAFQFYRHHDIVVSSNIKVKEDNIWKNVELSKKYDPIDRPTKAYHLVTTTNTIYTVNNRQNIVELRDYMEYNCNKLYAKLEKIITE